MVCKLITQIGKMGIFANAKEKLITKGNGFDAYGRTHGQLCLKMNGFNLCSCQLTKYSRFYRLPMQNQKAELRTFIRSLPQSSGVYLMRDRLGHVIYVGKAKNLKRRVSSYFQGSRRFVRAQPKIAAMVEMVCEISIHQTKNETEALLLEGKLIK